MNGGHTQYFCIKDTKTQEQRTHMIFFTKDTKTQEWTTQMTFFYQRHKNTRTEDTQNIFKQTTLHTHLANKHTPFLFYMRTQKHKNS